MNWMLEQAGTVVFLGRSRVEVTWTERMCSDTLHPVSDPSPLASKIAIAQARIVGIMWAQRTCRGEYRSRARWPDYDDKLRAIARRLVAGVAKGERDRRHTPVPAEQLLDELAAACNDEAATWWANRPPGYRP